MGIDEAAKLTTLRAAIDWHAHKLGWKTTWTADHLTLTDQLENVLLKSDIDEPALERALHFIRADTDTDIPS